MSDARAILREGGSERQLPHETQNEKYIRQGRRQMNCHIQIGLWGRLKAISETHGVKIWKLLSMAILEAVTVWEKDGVVFDPIHQSIHSIHNHEGENNSHEG